MNSSAVLNALIESNLYSRYSGLLSLSKLSLQLIDTAGKVMLEFNPCPDFCKSICQIDSIYICPDYQEYFNLGCYKRFLCRHGLENMLVPIEFDGQVAGYIVGAQVYSADQEYRKYLIDIAALVGQRRLEPATIAKSIAALKSVEETKIAIHQQICSYIARNIAYDLIDNVNHTNTVVTQLSIEKELLEKKIIDLEAKNMSLVINPHFLFNTLNLIARVAYFEKSHTTEELIYCLSDLLRYNLKQDDELHTIGAETDNIEKYLHIQKVRFKSRLEYEIDIDDSFKSYRIPNMILQPIVENALIHGITPKRDGGKIKVYAEKHRYDIHISVMDNGKGFSAESLQKLYQADSKQGIGFRSADKRLKRFFGGSYGLSVAKSDYNGSIVTVRLPSKVNMG